MEIWKDVIGLGEFYQVSNLGRVRSKDRIVMGGNGPRLHRGKELIPQPNSKGYFRVNLTDANGNKKFYFIHRMVAAAFVENPSGKPHVNHLDCNPKNNKADNLEWVTHQENMLYAKNLGRMVKTGSWLANYRKAIECQRMPVVGINTKTGESIYFPSMQEAGRSGFVAGSICHCCKGKRYTHHGYTWKYATNTPDEVAKMKGLWGAQEDKSAGDKSSGQKASA